MRAPSHAYRGFTLVELIATITILAILAAVTLPRMTAATPLPFQERGYADVIAASLRQARAVALASSCAVEFTLDANGYRALQRAAVAGRCAAGGAFVTPVLSGTPPAGVIPAAGRTLTFLPDGQLSGGAAAINLGYQAINVDASGMVQGP
jgi:prepilin-type N-terminal cleavage/methylation domain-containing protein